MPKFADDLVEVSVGKDIESVENHLQEATDKLPDWAQREGMPLNVTKTKVMVFGERSEKKLRSG